MRAFAAMALLTALCLVPPGRAAAADREFLTSDGARLHYTETGHGHTIVLVPGWTMPAWIWDAQIADFARHFRVIAFDPRAQGDSEAAPSGYDAPRRGQDIAELIRELGPDPVLLVGWSLGVLDVLAYVHTHGDGRIAGLVLVDNSVGEEPPPMPAPPPLHRGPPPSHEVAMRRFVQGMFHRPQNAAYLQRLTEATLHTPEAACRELLSYPVPRTYWREAIYSTAKPVLYVVRPGFAAQAENLQARRPNTETALFANAGHALFIDDAARFNAVLANFLARRIWP